MFYIFVGFLMQAFFPVPKEHFAKHEKFMYFEYI